MELLFKTRSTEYTGPGSLPNGSLDNTSEWQPMTKYLEAGAENYPDKAMFKIADGDGKVIETYTYKETNDKANQVANGLISKVGVKKGDKVGMYMLNCSEFVLSILAIHKTGGIQVPINKDEKGERLAYIINYSDQVALVVDPSGLPLIQDIADKLENLKIIYVTGNAADVPNKIGSIPAEPFNSLQEFPTENPNVDVQISDKERCMFTSGTTGDAKGVIISHQSVMDRIKSANEGLMLTENDKVFWVLPMAFHFVVSIVLFLKYGITIVVNSNFSSVSF